MTATREMARATAMTWAMAMVTRLAGKKEGKVKGSKGNGDSDEGVTPARRWQWQQGWQASRGRWQQRGQW